MSTYTRKNVQMAGARSRARTARREAFDRKIVGSFFMGEPVGKHFKRKTRKSKTFGRKILTTNLPEEFTDINDPKYLKVAAPVEGLYRYTGVADGLLDNHFSKKVVQDYFFLTDKAIRACVNKNDTEISRLFSYTSYMSLLSEDATNGDISSARNSIGFLNNIVKKEKKLRTPTEGAKLSALASKFMGCIMNVLYENEEITREIMDTILEKKGEEDEISELLGRMTF